jgi:hypothetical protein
MVVIMPRMMPNSLWITFATGARQFVVHEAFDMILCFAGSNVSSLTPRHIVASGSFAGAEIMTHFAPASMFCRGRPVNRLRLIRDDIDPKIVPRQFSGSLQPTSYFILIYSYASAPALTSDERCHEIVLQQMGKGFIGEIIDGATFSSLRPACSESSFNSLKPFMRHVMPYILLLSIITEKNKSSPHFTKQE